MVLRGGGRAYVGQREDRVVATRDCSEKTKG